MRRWFKRIGFSALALVLLTAIGLAVWEPLTARAPVGRYGLTSMRERAEALGGQLVLVSAPDPGTIITVTLPLHH